MSSTSRLSSPHDGTEHDDDPALDLAMFQEPADYSFNPSPPSKLINHTLLSGRTLALRLVGHNPLWAHHLWQGATSLTTYLQHHRHLIHRKSILELGAGAALPSILCTSELGAARVVVTDYPDAELIDNIARNIAGNCSPGQRITAQGYLWGADVRPLLDALRSDGGGSSSREGEGVGEAEAEAGEGFDVLILADCVFNHSCHEALVRTIMQAMRKSEESVAYVFFTPYRPWLLERDMTFFRMCEEGGLLKVEKVWEERVERVMFEGDRGDEELRKTVFGYTVKWANLP